MATKSWRYLTTHFRKLSVGQQQKYLRGDMRIYPYKGISAEFAKWVYLNLPPESWLRLDALRCIAYDRNCHWARDFFWRELEKHKMTPQGDLVAEAMCSVNVPPSKIIEDMDRLTAIFRDENVHANTRGGAVWTIAELVS